jgi:membrane protein DedA with SNARE-associated domain
MLSLLPGSLPHLIHLDGTWVVAGLIMLECLGLPVPGETALISAAIYAGTTHRLGIGSVLLAAGGAAILGSTLGFWIGRAAGYPLALRYGGYIGLTERRLKLGQYMFMRHGGKIVFLSRFIAILRALAAFLAGANRMEWGRFMLFNITGAVLWAGAFGTAAYTLGTQVHRLEGPIGIGAGVVIGVLVIAGMVLIRQQHGRMQEAAEIAFPGPLRPPHRAGHCSR